MPLRKTVVVVGTLMLASTVDGTVSVTVLISVLGTPLRLLDSVVFRLKVTVDVCTTVETELDNSVTVRVCICGVSVVSDEFCAIKTVVVALTVTAGSVTEFVSVLVSVLVSVTGGSRELSNNEPF